MARTSKFSDVKVQVLEQLGTAAAAHSKVPAIRELAEHFEVAPATMHSWLSKLAKEGLIQWQVGRHRSVRLTPKGLQMLQKVSQP